MDSIAPERRLPGPQAVLAAGGSRFRPPGRSSLSLGGFDGDDLDAVLEPPAGPHEDGSLRVLRVVGRSIARAVIGGILVGLAAAALRELAPEQFATRMSSAAIGWIACILLLVVQLAAAGRTTR